MSKSVSALLCVVGLLMVGNVVSAQEKVDSLRTNVERYVARNFSESRTLNLYWEASPAHDYTLERNGQKIESGRMKMLRTIKFQTMVPVARSRKFSLYAEGEFNTHHIEIDGDKSMFTFDDDHHDNHLYYKAGLRANYFMRFMGKPLLLSSSVGMDGWEHGLQRLQGSVTALVSVKQTAVNRVGVGLYLMYPYCVTPVVPVVTWSHMFDTHWLLDLTLPSRTYLRYQTGNSRFSAGASLDTEHFYLRPGLEGLSETCYYSKTVVRPEVVYECILDKHFYLIVRAGAQGVINGGLYNTNRKGDGSDPLVKISHPMTPFVNIGCSYNIF